MKYCVLAASRALAAIGPGLARRRAWPPPPPSCSTSEEWWSASARAAAIYIRSYRHHDWSRRSHLRLAEPAPVPRSTSAMMLPARVRKWQETRTCGYIATEPETVALVQCRLMQRKRTSLSYEVLVEIVSRFPNCVQRVLFFFNCPHGLTHLQNNPIFPYSLCWTWMTKMCGMLPETTVD